MVGHLKFNFIQDCVIFKYGPFIAKEYDRDRLMKLGFDKYPAKLFTEKQLNQTIPALFQG